VPIPLRSNNQQNYGEIFIFLNSEERAKLFPYQGIAARKPAYIWLTVASTWSQFAYIEKYNLGHNLISVHFCIRVCKEDKGN
jgi:hypothetical protein